MKKTLLLAILLSSLSGSVADDKPSRPVEFIHALAKQRRVSAIEGIILKGDDRLTTPVAFKPPVEITIVAKTDSTDLRFAYAADQIIFNWRDERGQLRIDGGPADGRHKRAAGTIPSKKFVTIRCVVLPSKQSIYVDDQLRFEHTGDYSAIDNAVSVFGGAGSRVTVKSLKVLQLQSPAE